MPIFFVEKMRGAFAVQQLFSYFDLVTDELYQKILLIQPETVKEINLKNFVSFAFVFTDING